MSINQEAVEYKAKVQERLGQKFSIITGDMDRVRAAGTINAALRVGQSAPTLNGHSPESPREFSAPLPRPGSSPVCCTK